MLRFSAISKTLHHIPYATIREAIVRKSLIRGVPVRFINPAYTSILGGLFTGMNRDKATALVIGLKGSTQGLELLDSLCQKLLTQDLPKEGIRYKVEVKNRFSEIVKVKEVSDCQSASVQDARDKSVATAASRLGSLLVDVIRHRKKVQARRKLGQRLSTVVLLSDIGPTARPRHQRRRDGPKVKREQEFTVQE